MSNRELEALRRKKLWELKRQLERKAVAGTSQTSEASKTASPTEVLNRLFVDRAWEVFNAAKSQYPQVAVEIEKTLVRLIQEGKLRAAITGEELYGLFLRLGFRVRLRTRIRVLEHGKVKSLEEKIKEETSV